MANRKNGKTSLSISSKKGKGNNSNGKFSVSIKTRKRLSDAAKRRLRDDIGRFI